MPIKHPASNYTFDELYTAIQAEINEGRVFKLTGKDEFEGLEIFTYSRECQQNVSWNQINRITRGIILCPSQKRIIALPFEKFFNYGEITKDLPNANFEATFKMDGSLGIGFFWNNKWHVTTRANFTSYQARWATNWLQSHTNGLNKETTYLFEIIFSENRIVIKYNFNSLILLTAFRLNGQELTTQELTAVSEKADIPLVKKHSCNNLTELIPLVRDFDKTQEGVVLHYETGQRVKIKGEYYCTLHRKIANIRPLYIWEQLLKQETPEADIPEEFLQDLIRIKNILLETEKRLLAELEELHNQFKNIPDRELAPKIAPINNTLKNYLFIFRRNTFFPAYTKLDRTKKEPITQLRRSFWEQFKPKNNVLPGYKPSSSMNLFATNDDQ